MVYNNPRGAKRPKYLKNLLTPEGFIVDRTIIRVINPAARGIPRYLKRSNVMLNAMH